ISARTAAMEEPRASSQRSPPFTARRTGGSWTRMLVGVGIDAHDAREAGGNLIPMVAAVGARVDRAGSGAEIEAAGVHLVRAHRAAQDGGEAVVGKACGERLPTLAVARAIDGELAVAREAEVVAVERHDENVAGFQVHRGGETESAVVAVGEFGDRKAFLHHLPGVPAVGALVHAAMFLAVEGTRIARVVGDAVNALAGRGWSGVDRGGDALVLRRPG